MKRHTGILLLTVAALAPLSTFALPAVTRIGDDRFKRIEVGETQQQVRDLLGAPTSTTRSRGETHYVYNYLDTWGMRAVFDVAFDANGRVEKTAQLRTSY